MIAGKKEELICAKASRSNTFSVNCLKAWKNELVDPDYLKGKGWMGNQTRRKNVWFLILLVDGKPSNWQYQSAHGDTSIEDIDAMERGLITVKKRNWHQNEGILSFKLIGWIETASTIIYRDRSTKLSKYTNFDLSKSQVRCFLIYKRYFFFSNPWTSMAIFLRKKRTYYAFWTISHINIYLSFEGTGCVTSGRFSLAVSPTLWRFISSL